MVALKHRLGVEQLILPAMPVAERRSVWREHTAERWLRDDPEGYAECVQAIREGEVNQVHLAERFGRSTNTIHALMMREFSVEDLQGFNAKAAAIASMQARSRATALVHEAGVKELGAVGMVAKTEFDVAQLGSGGPTAIHEERRVLRVEDFRIVAQPAGSGGAAAREEGSGMGSEGEKVLALGAGRPPDLVGAVVAGGEGRVMEAVVVDGAARDRASDAGEVKHAETEA